MDHQDPLPIRKNESAFHLPPSPSPFTSTPTMANTPTKASAPFVTPHRPKLPFQTPSMLLTPPPTTPSKKISRHFFGPAATHLELRTSAFPATPRKRKGVMIIMGEDDDEEEVETIMESEMEIQTQEAMQREKIYQTPQKQKIHVDERVVPDAPRKQRFRDFAARKGGEEKAMGGGVRLDFAGDGIRKRGGGVARAGVRGKNTGRFVRRMEEVYGEGVFERGVEDRGTGQKRGHEGGMGTEMEKEDGRLEKRRKVDAHVDELEDTFMTDMEYTQDMQAVIATRPLSWQNNNKVGEK